MEENKKKPEEVQGRNNGQQFSDEGLLREGRAQGEPSINNTGGDTRNNRQINPNESRIMGNPATEANRHAEELPNRETDSKENSH